MIFQQGIKPLSGNIMVFDNNGHAGPAGPSRIVESNPTTNGFEWLYAGTRDKPFWSKTAGSKQTLPNGNVLVTSSLFGRIFEVTRHGDVVWEFLNPKRRRQRGTEWIPLTCGAKRYTDAQLTFVSPTDDGK
jgi:hypothetical protein